MALPQNYRNTHVLQPGFWILRPKVLALLAKHPGGMARRDICAALNRKSFASVLLDTDIITHIGNAKNLDTVFRLTPAGLAEARTLSNTAIPDGVSVHPQAPQSANHADMLLDAELDAAADACEANGDFSAANEEDARKRVMREIVQRHGQPRFRAELIEAYGGRCAVTKCSVIRVLEAAHIAPYRGEQTNTVTNGLLLRSDIHTLFDLNLLGINPDDDFKVTFAASVIGGTYEKLNGTKLRLPKDDRQTPSQELLRIRWREFLDQ